VNLRKVVLPTRAAQELAGLPADIRVYVEAYLENLDVLLGSVPLGRISMLWEKSQDPGGFVAHVEGARLLIATDNASGVPIISRIERHAPPAAT